MNKDVIIIIILSGWIAAGCRSPDYSWVKPTPPGAHEVEPEVIPGAVYYPTNPTETKDVEETQADRDRIGAAMWAEHERANDGAVYHSQPERVYVPVPVYTQPPPQPDMTGVLKAQALRQLMQDMQQGNERN